jgi:hypothetical protein
MKRQHQGLVLGNNPDTGEELVLPDELRDQHLYITGATRSGKSKLLEYLVRQDIAAWRENGGCGLLVIDPHGSLYDSLIHFLAWHRPDLPIVPIDLRRTDTAVSYNPLRQQGGGASVLVAALVDAISFVWGETGTNKTPRFERKATDLLATLYEKQFTLAESEYLLDPVGKSVRRGITRNVAKPTARKAWEFADTLTPTQFDEKFESTMHRLGRFNETDQIRRIFGAGGVSLDFRQALDEGYIVFVCSATEGNVVSKRDARLFSTLLLTDLWHAASARGKGTMKKPKPFRVWLDEFQTMLSPTIAENLDQAGGYGLHLGLAHQFPRQLIHAGPHGEQVLDSVIVNARTKCVFCMSGVANLEPLAQDLFMGTMDPELIRREIYSTKIMGFREETRTIYGRSSGKSQTRGESTGQSSGEQLSLTHRFEINDAGIRVDPFPRGKEEIQNTGTSNSDSSSDNHSETSSETESESEVPFQVAEFGKELSSVENVPLADQLHKAMVTLHDQEQRHFTVRIVNQKVPQRLKTPTITLPPGTPESVEAYLSKLRQRWQFIVPAEEADKRIEERRQKILALNYATHDAEPVSFKRVVVKTKKGQP